ncbi:hypothetical protein ACQR00_31540, partial [Bradyrhizobium sp. HKCCYLS2033]
SDPATGGWSEPPVRTFWQVSNTQEREVSVKTIAQGMPDVGWTCGDCRLLFSAGGPWVAACSPAFPAPSDFEGERQQHHSGSPCRENNFA